MSYNDGQDTGNYGGEDDGHRKRDTSRKRDGKKDKKDKGYTMFEEEDSEEERPVLPDDVKSPSKAKKDRVKPTFKFPVRKEKTKEKEEKRDKEAKKEEKEKKREEKEGKKTKKEKGKGKPFHHDPRDTTPLPNQYENPIFGVPLAVAVERDKSHDGIELPAIFRECVDYIEECGLACEGIYRISGVKSKVQALKDSYNRHQPLHLYEHEPNIVASLLKQFLRDLPEPVLTNAMMPKFEESSTFKSNKKKVDAFSRLVADLPTCNRLLLSWMIVHMTHVIDLANENKMTLQNVSIVLSPTMQISHRVLNVLFSNANALFGNVQLRKYVPPLKPANSKWSLELPDNLTDLREELAKQESLLNQLHTELHSGLTDPVMEEQLWEVQRVVTQLKRKIKMAKKSSDSADRSRHGGDLRMSNTSLASLSAPEELKLELRTAPAPASAAAPTTKTVTVVVEPQPQPQPQPPSPSSAEPAEEKTKDKDKESAKKESSRTVKFDVGDDSVADGETAVEKLQASQDAEDDDATGTNEETVEENNDVLEKEDDKDESVNASDNVCEEKEDEVEEEATAAEGTSDETEKPNPPEADEDVAENQAGPEEVRLPQETAALKLKEQAVPDEKKDVEGVSVSVSVSVDRNIESEKPVPPPETVSESPRMERKMEEDSTQSVAVLRKDSQSLPPFMNFTLLEPVKAEMPKPRKEEDVDVAAKENLRKSEELRELEEELLGDKKPPVEKKSEEANQQTAPEEDAETEETVQVDEEVEKLLEEEYALGMEEEELCAIADELRQKIATERSEMERLMQEIQELQYLRQDSDLDEMSSDSNSSEDSEDEDDLQELLAQVIQDNEELEMNNADLCQKIHEERMICLSVKLQIRLLQQKQLETSYG